MSVRVGALRRAGGGGRAATRAWSPARTCPGITGSGRRRRRARRDRRARPARRRAGPRRGARRRERARLRLLRRLGPEVAVRAERHRLPLRARRPDRGARAALAGLRHVLDGPAASARLAAAPGRRAGSTPASRLTTSVEWALAALDVLEEPGIDAVQRARRRAGGRARRAARGRGVEVAPRGRSTLVSLGCRRPRGRGRARCSAAGFVVRDLPGTGYRARLGGRVDDRGGARPPSCAERPLLVVMTTMPNTIAATTTASASTPDRAVDDRADRRAPRGRGRRARHAEDRHAVDRRHPDARARATPRSPRAARPSRRSRRSSVPSAAP